MTPRRVRRRASGGRGSSAARGGLAEAARLCRQIAADPRRRE
jgi:hypothetical protein